MNLAEETVVVVDDDLLVLEAIAQQLASLGVTRIHRCESALDALALLHANVQVTTLLSDIAMPGMDGPQFLRELAMLRFRGRIVLISGVSNDLMHSIGELGRSHGLNVTGFIHKPVSPATLRTLLEGAPAVARAPADGAGGSSAGRSAALDVGRLRDALARGEIRPFYQPKVEAQSLRVIGVEALARWRQPQGWVAPGQFVPAMESAGLADALFDVMLRQVVADLARWMDAGITLKAAINLSMDCALRLDLPDRLQGILAGAGVAPAQLVVEVTESRLMSDRAAAFETLSRLSLMGLMLSIDDFGTGYSGLAQLADLPFGELKVDGGFVRRAGSDSKADAILETTVTFGRSLGMDVVAEGVETHAQLDHLRALGASQLQGYLIARPMPAADLMRWLASWRPGTVARPGCARPLTVLVVDDSTAMRAVIEAELRQRLPGIEVLHAEDADTAEQVFVSQPVDATTLDFHMPGRDGLQLLAALRDRSPATRHVVLTANLSEDVARRATALGAMYCPKPLTEHQADRIARYLKDI